MPLFSNFLSELKARNVRKTIAIYVGAALTTVGIIKLFMETYSLPTSVLPIIVTILTCGIGSAFVFAWFHGKEGAQKFSWKELLLHSVITALALVSSFQIEPSRITPVFSRGANTIAVLPFKNMSDNKEDEYFSDGITEDILMQLAKISDLNVISRTSIMKYKNVERNIREIAGELGANAVLEGSTRRIGNRVRITGQLIYAREDKHIWAETYDRDMKDIFAIQAEVAQTIASALKAKLSPQEEKLLHKEPTQNLDAYNFYLNGRNYYYLTTKDANEQAIVLFKKAINLDSSYALAYAGLADAYTQRYQRYGFEESWADSSIVLSLRAVALDPNIAEPYKSLGLAYYQKEWYRRAMEQYRKALDLNPSFASVYANMGELLDWTGHQDEALPLILKSIRLQPGRASDLMKLGSVYFSLGLLDRSAAMFRKAIDLSPATTAPHSNLAEIHQVKRDFAGARLQLDSIRAKNPDDPGILYTSGNVELYDRKYGRALVFYQKLFDLSPNYPGLTTALGFVLQKTGRMKEGNSLLDRSIAINQRQMEALSEEGSRRYDLARVYAIRLDTTRALKMLQEAIDRGSGIVGFIDGDPLLESLRASPEFQHLMVNLSARVEAMRSKVEAIENTSPTM